jgi:ribonuclease HI
MSCPGIGAAVVHVPANADTGREERTVAIKCKYREGDTTKAEVNTINRAELAAIKVALEVAPELLATAARP